MIEHVYRRAAETRGVDAVLVATDDERIAAAVRAFGGVVRMTAGTHATGTDRLAEIARELESEIFVNVQGDLPLIEPGMIAEVIEPLTRDRAATMSTLRRVITDPAELGNPNVVKVVVDLEGRALYFSRAAIPHVNPATPGGARDEKASVMPGGIRICKHIGLYAYRRAFLLTLAALPRTPLEQAESLEQLRALEHGYRIHTVETRYESIEVDTPEDLERVRRSVMTGTRA
jgi:3-deoxy-manno-octulosonate cytidylyltransferase (CMP-KDO synthetase)